ncbi:LysR family transcriptional regulator [Coraliomargarita parva]|uniref:LysR family transcriptional regulator n=1 Tax=Coraliomargarita parva TaxID=3014050 RepID=UPI0022B37A1A|nr:LysR family transcriptional regulator [Coraliomargarita parva]
MKSPFPRMDPEWLTTFLAIAEHGGVLPAARALHLTQPALSARLRRLEDAVGESLFERSRQGMRLTPAGERLLPVARKLPLVLQEALAVVDPAAAERFGGPLRLAASSTLADFVLPEWIARFVREHDIKGVELRAGNTDEVLAAVRGGRVELGAVEGLKHAAGLKLCAFAKDHIIAVYSPTQLKPAIRKELKSVTSIEGLAQFPILWREPGSGTRRVIEEMFRHSGVQLSALSMEWVFAGTLSLKRAAIHGLGIAFLPSQTVQNEIENGQLTCLQAPSTGIERTFSWVQTSTDLPPVLEAFCRYVETSLNA